MSPKLYPAAAGYIVNMVVSALLAFHVLGVAQGRAAATGIVALTSLVTAFLVHPPTVAVATGAFQTFAVSLAGFGFHLHGQQLASVVAIFGFVAAIVTHQHVIPRVAAKQSITGNELDRRRALGTSGKVAA